MARRTGKDVVTQEHGVEVVEIPDEWIDALTKHKKAVDGFTIRELAEKASCTPRAMQNYIRDAVLRGDFEFAGKKSIDRADGTTVRVNAYRRVKG